MLNASGEYHGAYSNFEIGLTAREDVPEAMRALPGQIARRAEVMLHDTFVRHVRLNVLEERSTAATGRSTRLWPAGLGRSLWCC